MQLTYQAYVVAVQRRELPILTNFRGASIGKYRPRLLMALARKKFLLGRADF